MIQISTNALALALTLAQTLNMIALQSSSNAQSLLPFLTSPPGKSTHLPGLLDPAKIS